MLSKLCINVFLYMTMVTMANAHDVLLLTERDCGRSFTLRPSIEIRLDALPSAGYDWYLVTHVQSIAVKNDYKSQNIKKIGSKVEHAFLIDIIAATNIVDLVFEYKRPWEQKIMRTCTFHLHAMAK